MKKVFFLLLIVPSFLQSQNVGIGVPNPQQKLHVGGSIRADALSGSNGILKYNSSGDLVTLPNSGNINEALLGNGSWGTVNGTVPAGAVVATETYNDANLINKGFALYGSIPGFSKYVSSSFTANSGTWAVTYYKGNTAKYSPPFFDGNDLIVWADTVLYLFADNSLYAYNPVSDTWRFVFFNTSGFSASPNSKAVWTGTEILVYGGYHTTATNNGFRYNPGTNVWTAIPTTNQPSARSDFAMHLINNRLVIWGGLAANFTTLLNTGAMLDLTTNTWTTISTVNAPSARYNFASVATTSNSMIVWGGRVITVASINVIGDGAVFNPATNSWATMSNTGAPVARHDHTAVWSGTEMVVFGGGSGVLGSAYLNSGGKYNPVTNTWTTTSTTNAPSGRVTPSSIWTGSKVLISGGSTGGYGNPPGTPFAADSYLYDPIVNSWSASGTMGVRISDHLSIKCGDIIIVFGGSTSVSNPISGQNNLYLGWPQGSRYFLANTATSKTEIFNVSDLYLYIKQ